MTGSEQLAVPPRRYLVGVDGSTESLEALRWAVAEARAHGGVVRAVLAWAMPYRGLATSLAPAPYGFPDSTVIKHAAGTQLTTAMETLGDTSGVEVDAEVREGQPAAVLVELAREADLVVLGSRGHGGFGALLIGSVCAQVVRHAPCSVLVVRPSS
jgi:nucleotide-binding universal stress UspA family protein